MLRKLDKYYTSLARLMREAYLLFGENGAFSAINNSQDKLTEIIITTNERTAGLAGGFEIVGDEKSYQNGRRSKDFSEHTVNNLEAFIAESGVNSVFLAIGTQRDVAAKIIADSINLGLSEIEISNRLFDEFKGVTGGFGSVQASRIARTEAGIAGSHGQDFGAREIGADTKQWIDVGDLRTRSHHADVSLVRVGIDDFFHPNGQSMSFPHDSTHGATASNIVNCRCLALYD